MRYGIFIAVFCVFGNAQAATYVYQANAYQSHYGRCGGNLLPFQVTITTPEAVPPSTTAQVPFKTLTVTAGGAYLWGERFNRMHSDAATFTTDTNGKSVAWSSSGGASTRKVFITHNEPDDIVDTIRFRCGGAEVQGNPGVWTQTE